MGRVVGVEVCGDQLAAGQRPVVGVDGRTAAGLAVAVVLVGTHAPRVAAEDAGPESLLVPGAVAALPGGTAALLGLGTVLGAPAGVGELGAAGDGADCAGSASGHGDNLPARTVLHRGEGVQWCVRMLLPGCSWRRWCCCW